MLFYIVNTLLILAIIILVWQTVNFFYENYQEQNLLSDNNFNLKKSESESNKNIKNINNINIKQLHLFGHVLNNTKTIPLSALDIKLTGIFFGGQDNKNQASILINQQEKIYPENAKLPNGAIVEKIFQNEVIIKYNGELQRLSLYANNKK